MIVEAGKARKTESLISVACVDLLCFVWKQTGQNMCRAGEARSGIRAGDAHLCKCRDSSDTDHTALGPRTLPDMPCLGKGEKVPNPAGKRQTQKRKLQLKEEGSREATSRMTKLQGSLS